jgi:mono/diheme cytochrome c family protein
MSSTSFSRALIATAIVWLVGLVGLAESPQTPSAPQSQAAAPSQGAGAATAGDADRQLLNRYCTSCHSDRLKTADLSLQSVDLENVGRDAATWEKVLRKLRAGAMPPVGRPRPDAQASARLTSRLESELDRLAAATPNPGRTASFHRLNRVEYQNAIRDILGLEVDVSGLLPGDDAAFGFDNIGEMLTVSPDLLDRYLSAANKISRLAVGDSSLQLGSATYEVSQYQLQSDRMSEDLPFSSRGGTAVRHQFPYTGEYAFKIRFAGVARQGETVELRIDGARVAEFTSTGRNFEDPADRGAVETRVEVKAGPRVVGVSFKKNTLMNETRYPQYFPWGNSATFATNTGSARVISVNTVDIAGPFNPKDAGETPSRQRLFVCRPARAQEEDACARKILTTVARKAYRRPVARADVDSLMPFFKQARGERDFDGAIQASLERLLVDPEFLFRVERDPENVAAGAAYRVDDLALASRLSFFLWSSVPDEELLQLAEKGKLKDSAVLEQQVRRMLADERSKTLVTNFAAQWLYLRNVRLAKPDSYHFPDWDDDLRAALVRETEQFLDYQLRADRGVAELLTADYTFLNERLAKHYGIAGVYGSHFRKVPLRDEDGRGGLLGHGSILLVTSFANRTSPVVRGKWLLENFLNYSPPPPPPDVPDLPPVAKGAQARSIRERIEQHRANPVCAACHNVMDPLGFALENYDAIGRYRKTADGVAIDASGATPDGQKFEGLAGLRSIMEKRSDDFVSTVAEKLLTYALGRGVEYYDQPAVRKIVRDAAPGEYRWSSIILGITKSVPFQMKIRREL